MQLTPLSGQSEILVTFVSSVQNMRSPNQLEATIYYNIESHIHLVNFEQPSKHFRGIFHILLKICDSNIKTVGQFVRYRICRPFWLYMDPENASSWQFLELPKDGSLWVEKLTFIGELWLFLIIVIKINNPLS